jgi:hypothetical protein
MSDQTAKTEPTSPKGTFVVAGEKAQQAADYAGEKLHDAGVYIADTAVAAKDKVVETGAAVGSYVASTAVAAKEKVVSATQTAEHSTAEGLRTAADKIDPETPKK